MAGQSSWDGYNSWNRQTEDDDNILTYGPQATAAYIGWLVAKDMRYYLAKFVYDLMSKLNKALLHVTEKGRDLERSKISSSLPWQMIWTIAARTAAVLLPLPARTAPCWPSGI